MIYVLSEYDWEYINIKGVFEGPDYLILDKIKEEFQGNFNYKTLGKIKTPKYKGPYVKYKSKDCIYSGGAFSSGYISSFGLKEGGLMPDENSQEYKEWQKACKKANDDWDKKYKEKMKEMKKLYPGKNEGEMFLSYLKKEYNFKEVAHKEFMV